jgi:ubiquinone/menaquinone biosynthesis C-methylase UbiE
MPLNLQLRNDVYRRPLETALDRLGIKPGFTCVDVGAGGGDVSVALAKLAGKNGRVYAVDIDPQSRDLTAEAAATAHAQVLTLTQNAEELTLPEKVDLAFCRFLLLHVHSPITVIKKMKEAIKPDGWIVIQEPVTTAGRINLKPLSMPDAKHQDIGALLPKLILEANLKLIDVWAEAPVGIKDGPVVDYLHYLTEVDPGTEPVILPPLVTAIAQK